MKKPIMQNKHYIMVFDTESNTKTGALTSWQVAPVLVKTDNVYPIERDDAVSYRIPLRKGNTKKCMDKFIEFIKDNFEAGSKIDFYVHNLKWDIYFILTYLIKHLNYTEDDYDMLITNLGQVFYISFSIDGYELKFIDSLKIIPFTLSEAGKSYNTKFKKIAGENYDTYLSDDYIENDVLCLSELIAIQNTLGITNKILTTSSWALHDYKKRLFKSDIGKKIVSEREKEIEKFSDSLKHKITDYWKSCRVKMSKQQATKDRYINMPFEEAWERAKKEEIAKANTPSYVYRKLFPQLDDLASSDTEKIEIGLHDFISLDSYCRQGYKGGLTYCNPDTRCKIFISKWYYDTHKDDLQLQEILKLPADRWQIVEHIYHYDVHSLYPSKCLYGYKDFNTYPIKKPRVLWGCPDSKLIKDTFENKAHFMIRFKCRFNIKDTDTFPSVQIKGDFHDPTEWLKTSKLMLDDKEIDKPCIMTLTDVEFFDFVIRYNIYDIEWIDYAVFRYVETGNSLFDCYMRYYYTEKAKAKSDYVRYQSIKQKLNALTGKFGTNPFGFEKTAFVDTEGCIKLSTNKYIKSYDLVNGDYELNTQASGSFIKLKNNTYFEIKRFDYDENTKTYIQNSTGKYYMDENGKYKVYPKNFYILRKDSEYVPLVAWITAYGRLTLLSEMDKASNNFEKNKSIYITGDTDSLFVAADKEWKPSLGVTDSDLNTFGLEHNPDEVAMFVSTGQKCYLMYGNFKNKAHNNRYEYGYDIKVAGMTQTQKDEFVKNSQYPVIDFANENVKVEGGKLITLPTVDGAVLVDTDFRKSSKVYPITQKMIDTKTKRWIPTDLEMFRTRYKFDINYRNLIKKLAQKYDYNIEAMSKELDYPITAEMVAMVFDSTW